MTLDPSDFHEKIKHDDPRIQWKTANLNGKTYEYMLVQKSESFTNTVFLIHGFPDLAYGWRYQILNLLSLNFRVIAPNMMGYGGTDSPESVEFYTYKRACDDLASLADQLNLSSIVVGGHDWGGAVAYYFALWYPKLISKLFVLATPFIAPMNKYIPLTELSNFKYQLQFIGPDVETAIVGEEKLRQFFRGIYGGRTPNGEAVMDVSYGIYLDRLESVGPPKFLSTGELEFYVKSYARNGLRGPLNWYRTNKLNFESLREFAVGSEGKKFFDMPVLHIMCTNDMALPPSLSEGMEVWFKDLTRVEVPSGHWVMVEKSAEVNKCIKKFLDADAKSTL